MARPVTFCRPETARVKPENPETSVKHDYQDQRQGSLSPRPRPA
jgi:hypothetical protein